MFSSFESAPVAGFRGGGMIPKEARMRTISDAAMCLEDCDGLPIDGLLRKNRKMRGVRDPQCREDRNNRSRNFQGQVVSAEPHVNLAARYEILCMSKTP